MRHGKLPHAKLKGLRLSAASFLPFQFLPDELLGLDIERSFYVDRLGEKRFPLKFPSRGFYHS
jgi:hypothetical protein